MQSSAIDSRCYLYILRSKVVDRYYIGVTADLDDRLQRHNQGRSLSTKAARPWEMVHIEGFDTRKEALARERQLKSWKNKQRLRELIAREGDV